MTRMIPAMALGPALDRCLSPGAFRCLALIRSLAGKARTLRTLTCSLARQLHRCVNTIRTYRDQLVAAGYLSWSTDPQSGVTTVDLLEPVEVQSRPAMKAPAPWPVEPSPAPWRRGGAQFPAPINRTLYKHFLLGTARDMPPGLPMGEPLPQPPRYTPDEQIAIILGLAEERG